MGVDTQKPILPAPTESPVDTIPDDIVGTGTELAADLSRRTDKTSYSVPDVGTPVVVPTRRRNRDHRGDDSKLSRAAQHSQTSLLIEYFEGGKGAGSIVSRPSVRVRVNPSARRSSNPQDQVHITESDGNRRPVYARRISLGGTPSKSHKQIEEPDEQSSSDENHNQSRGGPFEIELLNRGQGSEVSSDTRYIQPTSDISSMPADSLLEASSSGLNRKRSVSAERGARERRTDDGLLKTPARKRSRSLSTERIAHRVAEKLTNDPHERQQSNKAEAESDSRVPRRRARKQQAFEEMPSPDSSMLSAATSANRRSGDQYSVRSGVSNKSSINNPKLLETVEDAIRRLILPELKELKKDQKVVNNTSKFERDMSASNYSTGSTQSRNELGRRLSKHASAPDVRPKVILNKENKDDGTTPVADEPAPPTKAERKASRDSGLISDTDSVYAKWANRQEAHEQYKPQRAKSKGLGDAEKAGRVRNALTAAALRSHDSKSSLDKDEERSSVPPPQENGNETELVFKKHNVAPMPLRSALDSEMTRDSLVSQRTAETDDSTPYRARFQEVLRSLPVKSPSPNPQTQNRKPVDAHYGLGRHSNQSNHNLSVHDDDSDFAAAGDIAAAAMANLLDNHHDPAGRRTLSPIQSVVSEQSDMKEKRALQPSVEEDVTSEDGRQMQPQLSIDSFSSAPSTDLARSKRPQGAGKNESPQQRQDSAREQRHGDSVADTDPKRMTNYMDDSEIDYMDKMHEGQHVSNGHSASPQFVHPAPVESAVASLMEPSVLEARSAQLGGKRSQTNLQERRSPGVTAQQLTTRGSRQGSPLKQRQDASSPDATSFLKRMGVTSPPQSVTQSLDDQELGHSRSFDPGDDAQSPSPIPEAGDIDSESEINTNPSIIQGPGLADESQGHWPYDEIPSKTGQHDEPGASRGLGPDELSYDPGYYPEGAYAPDGYFEQHYMDDQMPDTPPAAKDEGYASGAQPHSPSAGTPKSVGMDFGGIDGMGLFDSPGANDGFGASHQRNLSGYSNGFGSPLYDSVTGKGVDRIQSKDIIALMDHLTVRDAQRNARDTEILVSLVRSAAEMRTSFEEMKKFIAQQDGMIMEANDRHHDRTHRALGGPRPLPPSNSRSRQLAAAAEREEIGSKRKNVFKRALKGLSLKSNNDLSRIEDMLEQLLDDVDALRAEQDEGFGRTRSRPASIDQGGYEAEGETGVSSGDNQYGDLSRAAIAQRNEENRPSTVPEADEEDEYDERGEFLSPQLQSQENPEHAMASGALAADASPPKSNDKDRKRKSGVSSIFPKFSRWSKTTASSMGDNIRNSMQPDRKDRSSFDNSRPVSDGFTNGPYNSEPQADDHVRSHVMFDDELPQQEDRPPSPLIPSQVSEAPKYRAHRDSTDMQHPQPRQGPTGRHQSQLENQAQIYRIPSSYSDQWGSNASLSAVNPNQRNSTNNRLSPISDGHSELSSRHPGPPRPPKVRDDGPLIPERSSKVRDDDERSYVDRVASRSSAMRSSPRNSPPARKPTGPRPLNSGSQYSRRSRVTSPDQVDDLDY